MSIQKFKLKDPAQLGTTTKCFQYFNDSNGNYVDTLDYVVKVYRSTDTKRSFNVAYFGHNKELIIQDVKDNVDYYYHETDAGLFFDLYKQMQVLYNAIKNVVD